MEYRAAPLDNWRKLCFVIQHRSYYITRARPTNPSPLFGYRWWICEAFRRANPIRAEQFSLATDRTCRRMSTTVYFTRPTTRRTACRLPLGAVIAPATVAVWRDDGGVVMAFADTCHEHKRSEHMSASSLSGLPSTPTCECSASTIIEPDSRAGVSPKSLRTIC